MCHQRAPSTGCSYSIKHGDAEANIIKITMRMLTAALLVYPPQAVWAQTPQQPTAQPASVSSQQLLSAGQLDALVAPIALYPDALLSEILMASTYPLEVVEADRWADAIDVEPPTQAFVELLRSLDVSHGDDVDL